MFRHIILASLVAVGMSSCTVAMIAGAPGAMSSLTPAAMVAAAR